MLKRLLGLIVNLQKERSYMLFKSNIDLETQYAVSTEKKSTSCPLHLEPQRGASRRGKPTRRSITFIWVRSTRIPRAGTRIRLGNFRRSVQLHSSQPWTAPPAKRHPSPLGEGTGVRSIYKKTLTFLTPAFSRLRISFYIVHVPQTQSPPYPSKTVTADVSSP